MSDGFDLFAPIRTKSLVRDARAAGIDLGTTNSAVAIAQLGPGGCIAVECLRDGTADDPSAPMTVPTVVAVDGDALVIGRDARTRLAERVESAQGKNVFAETKNEIGLRYSYWKAPPGLEDATAVAGVFLGALGRQFADALRGSAMPVVVGVPSAFQGMQRSATLEAAKSLRIEGRASGLSPLLQGDGARPAEVVLIDEPVAAFIDLVHRGELEGVDLAALRRVLVFDFGGGTCDVALFDLDLSGAQAKVVLRATSRYHRLGGGDIDRAIVHEVLLPQLLVQNRLHSLDLSWRQKKHEVEARLILCAEGLKHAMCRRIAQARLAGSVVGADFELMDSQQHRLAVDGKVLWLESATMTLADFERVLEPFLDDAVRVPGPNEYFNAVSVFEPIAGLIERLHLDPKSVGAVLFAGGSSLIPQVRDAVLRYFPNARALGGTDPEQLQGAVARGAALQALSLAVTGEPLIRSVSGIDIAIRTTDGLVDLIEEGAPLPVTKRAVTLAAPEDSDQDVELSVEIVAGKDRLLFRQEWALPARVDAGELLDLVISIDENQALTLRLSRRSGEAEDLLRTIGSPLSHTDASHKVRMRVLEREERIRRGEVDESDRGVEFRRLAEDYAELRHYEKAIDAMRTSIRAGEDAVMPITLIGNWYGRLQDRDRAEQCYRRAIEIEPSSAPIFNLAMTRRDSGDLAEALACVERAMAAGPSEPCHRILKADLLRRAGQIENSDRLLRDIAAEPQPLSELSDWQLSWFDFAASMKGDASWQAKLATEKARRKVNADEPRLGVLPRRA